MVRPAFAEQVGVTAARRLRALDLDYTASVRYTYRESEVVSGYAFDGRSQLVNRAAQRRADALRGALRLTHVSLRWRTVSKLYLTAYRVGSASNLAGAPGEVLRCGMRAEYRLSWRGYFGVAPTLIVGHVREDVTGAVEAARRETTASLRIAYASSRWRGDVRGSLGRANAGGVVARTYGYLEASLSYERREGGTGVVLGLRGYNLTGERRARVVSFRQPLLRDARAEAAPTAIVAEAWVPIRLPSRR